MDPGLLLVPLAPPVPTPMALLLPTALVPLPIAWTAVPPDLRIAWVMADPALPAGPVVRLALARDRWEDAWVLARRARAQPGGWAAAEPDLHAWALAEADRLGATGGGAIRVIGDARLAGDAALALRDLAAAGLVPRPWAGPILVVVDGSLPAAPDRPAAPVVVVPAPTDRGLPSRDTWRGAVAAAVAAAGLAQGCPRAPAWLVATLPAVVATVANGAGTRPRDAQERRQAAGEAAVAAVLTGNGDRELAQAVAVGLAQPRRRAALTALLHGAVADGLAPDLLARP
jgi:hypothetical protein